MAVHAEAVLIHTVNIVVLAHIDSVTVMISIATPHEIVIPQFFVVTEPIGKEGVGAEYRRGEGIVGCHELFRHHRPRRLDHFLPDEIPTGFERAIDEVLVHIPVLIVETGPTHIGVYA